MSDFVNSLFADTSKDTGINVVNTDHNHIINEAIILDKLDGNVEALNEFFNAIGQYGARDNILSESASIDCATASFNNEPCANTACVLAVAKESGCKDYALYMKALMLMKACMCNMKKTFGTIAEQRLEAQNAELNNNPRVVDALATAEACMRK